MSVEQELHALEAELLRSGASVPAKEPLREFLKLVCVQGWFKIIRVHCVRCAVCRLCVACGASISDAMHSLHCSPLLPSRLQLAQRSAGRCAYPTPSWLHAMECSSFRTIADRCLRKRVSARFWGGGCALGIGRPDRGMPLTTAAFPSNTQHHHSSHSLRTTQCGCFMSKWPWQR